MCIKACTVQGGYFYVAISSSWNCHQTNLCSPAVELSTLWWWEFASAHLKLIYLRLRGKRALSWLPQETNHKAKLDLISSWFAQQILKWSGYSLTRGRKKNKSDHPFHCVLLYGRGKEGESLSPSYTLTLNSRDKAHQIPRCCRWQGDGSRVLKWQVCKLWLVRLRSWTEPSGHVHGLLHNIKRRADTEITRRKADLRDMA